MRTALGLLRLEFRRSIALVCFPLMVGVAWWFSDVTMSSGFYIWLQTSVGIRQTILLVGPMMGGIAAWMAGRDPRRKMGDLLAVTPHSPVSRVLTTWGGTALWGVTVYGTLIAAMFALTLPSATWGTPLWGYLLVTLLAVVAFSALGFAAGHYVPSRFTAPIVAIGLFGAQILPYQVENRKVNYELLSPAPDNLVYREVFHEVPQVAAQQSLWILGLTGIALATIALKGYWWNVLAWGALGVSVVVAVAGFVVSVGVPNRATNAFAAELPYEPVCDKGKITVCLHPAYEPILPETIRKVNEIVEPLVGIPGTPKRTLQTGSTSAPAKETNTKDTALFSVTDLEDEELFTYLVATSFVVDPRKMYSPEGDIAMPEATEADLEKCGNFQEDQGMTKADMRKMFEPSMEAQEVIIAWLVNRSVDQPTGQYTFSTCSNFEKLVEDFASMEPKVREAWLNENFADLRAGKVTLKDLP